MLLSKRDQTRLERQLSSSLTDACEAAKAQMVGFTWLTHEVDFARFPESLQVTWIFTTEAHKAQALAQGQDALMRTLTRAALDEAEIDMDTVTAPVHVDSEEACERVDGGKWQARLARRLATQH